MSIRFIPVTLVAVLIALVAAGGAALAFGQGGGGGEEARDDLLERTAGELGLDPQVVKDAQAQAQSELAAERLQDLIDALVEKGSITQVQADEALAWLNAKPAAVNKLLSGDLSTLFRFSAGTVPSIVIGPARGSGGYALHDDVMERMAEILGMDPGALKDAVESAVNGQAEDRRLTVIDDAIARLVEDGELTLAEGDQVKAWLEAMPLWIKDRGLMVQLLTGALGNWDLQGGLDHLPFSHSFRGDMAPFPDLFDLRRQGPEHFFMPDGDFEFPRFEFQGPGDSGPENHFFYRGPEGQFDFEGEVPEQFRDLFEDMEGRFGDGFELPFDLGQFLEGRPFFQAPPVDETPDLPDGTDVSAESVKDA